MRKFQLTLEDFINAQKLHSNWKVWIVPVSFVSIIIYWLMGDQFTSPDPDERIISLSTFAIVAAITIACIPRTINGKRISAFRRQKSLREEITVEFDDTELRCSSESGSFKIQWSDFYAAKRGRGVVLFYETSNLMRIFPERIFNDGELENIFSKIEEK